MVRQASKGRIRVQLDAGIELPADKKDGMARPKQGVSNQPEIGSSINNGGQSGSALQPPTGHAGLKQWSSGGEMLHMMF